MWCTTTCIRHDDGLTISFSFYLKNLSHLFLWKRRWKWNTMWFCFNAVLIYSFLCCFHFHFSSLLSQFIFRFESKASRCAARILCARITTKISSGWGMLLCWNSMLFFPFRKRTSDRGRKFIFFILYKCACVSMWDSHFAVLRHYNSLHLVGVACRIASPTDSVMRCWNARWCAATREVTSVCKYYKSACYCGIPSANYPFSSKSNPLISTL